MAKSEFIPNTYQKPNLYVDQYMAFLTPNEWKVLDYAIRRILGFGKREDRISISQFSDGIKDKDGNNYDFGTGLSRGVVISSISSLVDFGFLTVVSPHDAKLNIAPKYSLQLDSEKIDKDAIMKRYEEKKGADREKAAKARKGIIKENDTLVYGTDQGKETNPSLCHRPGPVYATDQAQSMTQTDNIPEKPQERTDSLSANADEPAEEKSEDFLYEYFGVSSQGENGNGSKPTKPKRERDVVGERLEAWFARWRGCAVPVWPDRNYEGLTDAQIKAKKKADQKLAKGLMETHRKPLMEIYDRCNRDIDFAERAVKEIVLRMKADRLTFSTPIQIMRNFDSWLADQKPVYEKTDNIVTAPAVETGKTILQLQQEMG